MYADVDRKKAEIEEKEIRMSEQKGEYEEKKERAEKGMVKMGGSLMEKKVELKKLTEMLRVQKEEFKELEAKNQAAGMGEKEVNKLTDIIPENHGVRVLMASEFYRFDDY